MPTPQEIEAYLRQTGQGITQAGQNAINQNVDVPAQQKLAALQSASANAGAAGGMGGGMPGGPGQVPGAPAPGMAGGAAGSNAPSMNIDDAMAQRQKLVNMQNAASAEKANEWNEPDLSGYSNAAPQARQFPAIQAKMKSGQPVTTQDIRATLKGPQEVTPDLEKKLGYGKDDDEDDQASNNNNRAGSSEGSYGP